MTNKKQTNVKERGIKLAGEILEMVEQEMAFDNRPSLTNTNDQLVREAVAAREHRRSSEASVPEKPSV